MPGLRASSDFHQIRGDAQTMLEIIILCPKHGEEETIILPDAYTATGYSGAMSFEGDIPCNPSDGSEGIAVLHIKVHHGGGAFWLEELSLK